MTIQVVSVSEEGIDMGSAAEQVLNDNPAVKHMDDKGKEAATTLSGHATKLFDKLKQPRACVKDHEGYLVCGPIVGYERPSGGGMSSNLHEDKVRNDHAPFYRSSDK